MSHFQIFWPLYQSVFLLLWSYATDKSNLRREGFSLGCSLRGWRSLCWEGLNVECQCSIYYLLLFIPEPHPQGTVLSTHRVSPPQSGQLFSKHSCRYDQWCISILNLVELEMKINNYSLIFCSLPNIPDLKEQWTVNPCKSADAFCYHVGLATPLRLIQFFSGHVNTFGSFRKASQFGNLQFCCICDIDFHSIFCILFFTEYERQKLGIP